MSRRNITHLPLPNEKFRIDSTPAPLDHKPFESVADTRKEDEYRIRALQRRMKQVKAKAAKRPKKGKKHTTTKLASLRRLERKLETGLTGKEIDPSPASSITMRDFRIKATGAIWRLCAKAEKRGELLAAFHLVPRGAAWRVKPSALKGVNPTKLMATLRTDLYRQGKAKQADGWLYAVLQAEFEPISRRYQFHVHGIAAAGMVGAVRALIAQPKYTNDPVVTDRHVMQSNLYDLARIISYVHEPFWCQRANFRNEAGKRCRQRRKHRIQGKHFTDHLLWLDRFTMQDLTLLVGLQVTKRGLIHRKR